MQNPKTGGTRLNPDTRPENIDTYTETNGDQTATYKFFNAHPIISGILDKLAFFRTHAAAVYYNRLAGKTVKQKFDDVDAAVGELNENKSNINHTHNYAASASAGGSATSAVKLDTSAGSATQPVYFSGGKPVACTHTLKKSVPANAVFTDTWRDVVNNLTSTDTTKSLSAAQGKALNDKINHILEIESGAHLTIANDEQGFKFSIWSADYKYALFFNVLKADNAIMINCVRNGQWGTEKRIYP